MEMANKKEDGEEGNGKVVGDSKYHMTLSNSVVDPVFLDENFIRSFLSGNICLK